MAYAATSSSINLSKNSFNGGTYGLKDKTFDDGTKYWSKSSGIAEKSTGRINNGLRVRSTSFTRVTQTLAYQETSFIRGKQISFGFYFKGGYADQARAVVKSSNRIYFGWGYYYYYSSHVYGDWVDPTSDSTKPWVLASVTGSIPSTSYKLEVRIEVRDKYGYSIYSVLDDAEISTVWTNSQSGSISYQALSGVQRSFAIKYGLTANIFQQQPEPSNHRKNEMKIGINAFGATARGGIEKIHLQVELLPNKRDCAWWFFGNCLWWNDRYTTQDGNLDVKDHSSADNRLFKTSSTENSMLNDFSALIFQTTINYALDGALNVVWGGKAIGFALNVLNVDVGGIIAGAMVGNTETAANDLDANGGSDYLVEKDFNFKTVSSYNNRKIYDVARMAESNFVIDWTYRAYDNNNNPISGYAIKITATYYWGHYDVDRIGNGFYMSGGVTTSTITINV
jgi:hypothetical protein